MIVSSSKVTVSTCAAQIGVLKMEVKNLSIANEGGDDYKSLFI